MCVFNFRWINASYFPVYMPRNCHSILGWVYASTNWERMSPRKSLCNHTLAYPVPAVTIQIRYDIIDLTCVTAPSQEWEKEREREKRLEFRKKSPTKTANTMENKLVVVRRWSWQWHRWHSKAIIRFVIFGYTFLMRERRPAMQCKQSSSTRGRHCNEIRSFCSHEIQ